MVDNDSPGLLIIHGEDEPCSDDECGTNSARSVSFDTTEINADIQNLHSPLTPSGKENLRPLASEQGETVPVTTPTSTPISTSTTLRFIPRQSSFTRSSCWHYWEHRSQKEEFHQDGALSPCPTSTPIHKSTSKASQSYHRSKYMGRGYHFHCIVWPAQSRRTKTWGEKNKILFQ